MKILCTALSIVLFGMYLTTGTESLESQLGEIDERSAKSLLRSKRGFFSWLFGEDEDEEEGNEARQRERNREVNERTRESNLNRTCPALCWNAWPATWAPCSHTCGGGGVQWQSRSVKSAAVLGECQPWVVANGCPGEKSRSQACNRFCRNGGTPHANGCTCPAGWVDQCCGTRVTCPNPGTPTNGQATPGGTGLTYGTIVQFSCYQGYTLRGDSTRTCTQLGSWSNNVPGCQIISCGNPGTPANSKLEMVSGNDYVYLSSVRVTCNNGYRLLGDSVRRCEASGKWSGIAPSCLLIECPTEPAPANGQINYLSGRNVDAELRYTCNTGFVLQGSPIRKCQTNGAWAGILPTCQQILCNNLPAPMHGNVTHAGSSGGKTPFGQSATFTCDNGYVRTGLTQLICQGNSQVGTFSGKPPTCEPVNCGDPGTPNNGVRTGSQFTWGGTVSFTCGAGHFLQGTVSASCLPTGKWSSDLPACQACAVNTYKTGTNNARSCEVCPAHSISGTAASHITQCLCQRGYKGKPGGPCSLIICPDIPSPAYGRKVACGNKLDEQCVFQCNTGHVVSSGDTIRTCQENEQWTGADVICTACPVNTYKTSVSQCDLCPNNTHTNGTGKERSGCVCDEGYAGPDGGPCADINECATNKGNCEQTCINEPGKYVCECTDAGFVKDADDNKRCVSKNKCPLMTKPANGGTVCYAQRKTNTERCYVKCNKGFEHLQSPNAFEECGPSTNWQWTYDIKGEPIPDCIPAFFEGIQVGIEVFYFTQECNEISETEKQDIATDFALLLESKGVCRASDNGACSIDDVEIDCGDASRRKRDTMGDKVAIRFKLMSNQPQLPRDKDCYKDCKEAMKEVIKRNVQAEAIKVQKIYSDAEAAGGNVKLGGVLLMPTSIVNIGQPEPSCGKGQVYKNGNCVLVSCGYPQSPTNGRIAPGGHLYGNVAKLECNQYYKLFGDNVTKCQQNGKWTNFNTTCVHYRELRFDCMKNNPCEPRHIPNQDFYRHIDDNKFIHCGAKTTCNTVPCSQGLLWSQDLLVCVWPWQLYQNHTTVGNHAPKPTTAGVV